MKHGCLMPPFISYGELLEIVMLIRYWYGNFNGAGRPKSGAFQEMAPANGMLKHQKSCHLTWERDFRSSSMASRRKDSGENVRPLAGLMPDSFGSPSTISRSFVF